MANVYDRIADLCKARGITGGKMCNDLGISRSTLSELKSGRSTTLKLEKAKLIADYLEVPVDVLLGKFFYVDSWHKSVWEDWNNLYGEEEQKLMLTHNGVPPELRDEAARIFGIKKETAQMDGLSESDKTILSLLDELSPQEREKAVAVLKALVDKQ